MTYTPPIEEISAALNGIAGLLDLIAEDIYGDIDPGLVAAILEEAGKFAAERLAPLNKQGDEQGAVLDDGAVRMPEGWRDAYEQWCEAGWNGLPAPEAYGGQGLPVLLAMAVSEMWQSASMSFALNPMLTQGAVEAIAQFGSDELKSAYLPHMVTGKWAGTMQLTEPHAGSDLSSVKTMAAPQEDGSYLLSGTKIFITYGEHDLTDNIVHLVLARTPDAPEGTKGISLFLVPKFLPGPDGTPGERNDIHCMSLEHKLGIHASPTCVMQMGDKGGAKGWLVGELNKGLAAMFTMMNRARLAVGVQGTAIAERAYQQALGFAKERIQGRDLEGNETVIVNHPDVRRMLLTMKAKTAASRAVCLMTARYIDLAERSQDAAVSANSQDMASLLTPVAKAYSTDIGVEVASVGIQVHGGMGYVEETGAAQHLRDARIAPIYEGTNGIQAIDLVTRKLPLQDGAVVERHLEELRSILSDVKASNVLEFGNMARCLEEAVDALAEATGWMLMALRENLPGALGGATPYLKLFALASGGVWLAKGALATARGNAAPDTQQSLTARFFAENLSVEAPGLARAIMAGADWAAEKTVDASSG